MSYYQDSEKVRDVVEKALKTVDSDKIVMGAGLYKLTKAATLKQLEITEEHKIKVSVFFHTTF